MGKGFVGFVLVPGGTWPSKSLCGLDVTRNRILRPKWICHMDRVGQLPCSVVQWGPHSYGINLNDNRYSK